MTTRRRFITILAGAITLPAIGIKAATPPTSWRGIALGAQAQIILDHPDAQTLIAQAVDEIRRLEGIFSLYQDDSEISRLNRDGRLDNPSFEMLELLSISSAINARTSGAFDPTVQPLWALYADKYSAGSTPTNSEVKATLAVTGWQGLRFTANEIRFAQGGMAITLNGIAQGFIADKVTAIFRENGVTNVLVNTGEISGVGDSPDTSGWDVKLAGTNRSVVLQNAAIATSANLGTTFDQNGKVGHILDPRTGYPGGQWPSVSVIANSAAEADGLSTAFSLMNRENIRLAQQDTTVFLGATEI